MIVINNKPKNYNLTGNPVPLDITGQDMYSTPGQQAVFWMFFQSGTQITHGTGFTLNWGTHQLPITFVDNPDDSGQQFFTTTSLNNDWLVNFKQFLQNNYLISADFTIPTGIMLVARQTGAQYSISVTGNTVPATTVNFTSQAGVTAVKKSGYQLICQVWRNDVQENLGEDGITPDSNGNALFDIGEYLEIFLDEQRDVNAPLFTYPADTINIAQHSAYTVQFLLKYAEKWSGTVRKMHQVGPYVAFLGGLAQRKYDELQNGATNFSEWLIDNKKFLTWQPEIKKTGSKTPERLFWYNSIGTNIVELYAKKYYADGTTGTSRMYAKLIDGGNVAELMVGAKMFSTSTKTVVKYDVYLVIDEITVTETKTYHVDYDYHINEFYFLFRNSLGGYDTVRCTGSLYTGGDVNREVFSDEDQKRHPHLNMIDYQFTANTGPVTAEMAEWTDDLLLSKEVYWLKNGATYPILITETKKTEIEAAQRRFNIEFEYTVQPLEKYYSRLNETAQSGTPSITAEQITVDSQ